MNSLTVSALLLLVVVILRRTHATPTPASTSVAEKTREQVLEEVLLEGDSSGKLLLSYKEYQSYEMDKTHRGAHVKLTDQAWTRYKAIVEEMLKEVKNHLTDFSAEEAKAQSIFGKTDMDAELEKNGLRLYVLHCQRLVFVKLPAAVGDYLLIPTFIDAGKEAMESGQPVSEVKFRDLYKVYRAAVELATPNGDQYQLEWIRTNLYAKGAKNAAADLRVVIAGGGPGGLFGAWLLIEAGFQRVVVVGDRSDISDMGAIEIGDTFKLKGVRVRALGTDLHLAMNLPWVFGTHHFHANLAKAQLGEAHSRFEEQSKDRNIIMNSHDLEKELMTRFKALRDEINAHAGGNDPRIEIHFDWGVYPPIHFVDGYHQVEIRSSQPERKEEPQQLPFDILLMAVGACRELVYSTVGMAELRSLPEQHFSFSVVRSAEMRGSRLEGIEDVEWLDWAEIKKHLPEKILDESLDEGCPIAGALRERFDNFGELLVNGVDKESDDGKYTVKQKATDPVHRLRIVSILKTRETLQVNGEAPPILGILERVMRDAIEQKSKDWNKDEIYACKRMECRVKRAVFGAVLKALLTPKFLPIEELATLLNIESNGNFKEANETGRFNYQPCAVNTSLFEMAVRATRHAAFVHVARVAGAIRRAIIGVYGDALITTPYKTVRGLSAMREMIVGEVSILAEEFVAGHGFVKSTGIAEDSANTAVDKMVSHGDVVKEKITVGAEGKIRTPLHPKKSPDTTDEHDGATSVATPPDSNLTTFESVNKERLFERIKALLDGNKDKPTIPAEAYKYVLAYSAKDTKNEQCAAKGQECVFEIVLPKGQRVEVGITNDRLYEVKQLPPGSNVFESDGQAAMAATNALKLFENADGA